jgi:hypothetical protein
MTDFLHTLHRVKQRVDRYSANGINEQDTKANRQFMATDSWDFWHFTDRSGSSVPLSVARQQYLAKHPSTQ